MEQEKQQFLNVSPKNKQIFQYIEELLVTYDFRNAQISYFDKHCKSFENTQESQQIYPDLFKEYTNILEETINKKLANNFTQSEIKEFYEDFSKDQQKYSIGSGWINTVETLFTFTDFENFKNTTVDYYERKLKGKKNESKPYQKLNINPDFNTFHNYYSKDLSEFQIVLKGVNENEVSTYTIDHNDSVSVFVTRYTVKRVEQDTYLESYFKYDIEKIKAAMPFVKVMEQVYLDGEAKSDDVQTLYSQYEYPMSGRSDSLIRTEKGSFQDFKLLRQNSFEHQSYPVQQDMKRMQMYKQIYCRQIPGTKDTEVVDITFGEKQKEDDMPPMFKSMTIAKFTKDAITYFFNELRTKQAEKDAKK